MKIGIFGMGAVGASILNEMGKYNELYVLVDEKRLAKNKELIINDVVFTPNYITKGKMDLIIVCVKNYHLEKALPDIARFVDEKTIILPLLNGITAHDVLSNYFKNNRVLYGVINVEANKIDNVIKTSKIINLQFGYEFNNPILDEIKQIKDVFDEFNINNNVYENMKRRVWLKWMLNMGINQISALCNATYKDMSHPLLKELMTDIFKEVYNVSLAYNIGLTDDDLNETIKRMDKFNSNRVTSLTIDFNNNSENELDSFSKTLIDIAKMKNIPTPINEVLYKLLKSYDENKRQKGLI